MANAKFDIRRKNHFFKVLAMSKIVHLTLITNIPTPTMKELNKIKKNLFGKTKIQK